MAKGIHSTTSMLLQTYTNSRSAIICRTCEKTLALVLGSYSLLAEANCPPRRDESPGKTGHKADIFPTSEIGDKREESLTTTDLPHRTCRRNTYIGSAHYIQNHLLNEQTYYMYIPTVEEVKPKKRLDHSPLRGTCVSIHSVSQNIRPYIGPCLTLLTL